MDKETPYIQLFPREEERAAEHEKQRYTPADSRADEVEEHKGQALQRDLMVNIGPRMDHQDRQTAEDPTEVKLRSSHVPCSPSI